jgi:acetyltransferase
MASSTLNLFFRPHGIAVVGASRDPNKLGYGVVRNLVEHHYEGPIYPVNPRADEVLNLKAYADVADVPDPVDLAIIIVPAPAVAGVLERCGQRGIPAVTIVSGGFREAGPEGTAREAQIREIAARYGIAVLGPNCIGTIDTHTPLNSTFVTGSPIPGEIALISQSGAVAAAIIDWARGAGVGISRLVSLGNEAGVTEADMLRTVADDERTRVITAYVEGVSDGADFLDAAISVARDVPVVALKVGRGASGTRAVASHTGALAGAEAAYEAAFRRAGVLRASRLEEMLDWARALAWQPLPRGNRVAILTNAGGAGVLALDALEAHGMALAPLTDATRAFLRQRVPPAASVQNPVDILAGSGPATYALCLDALLADETVDAVVVITAPQDWFAPVSLAEVVGEVGNSPLGRRKPVLAAIMGLASTSEATAVLHRRQIPNFAFPERVGSTLAAMWQRKQWLDRIAEPAEPLPALTCDLATANDVLDAAREIIGERIGVMGFSPDETGWLAADQVTPLLNACHIAQPAMGLAPNASEALALAETVGYPVALKLAASGVTHKTDIGGVLLGIKNPDELRAAFADLLGRVRKAMPSLSVVDGVYVQHMIRDGVEIIVGVVRDAQFGPLVMAGAGGTQVELRRDVAFDLAPISRQQANDLLEQTHAGRLLDGFRGAPPADREAVIDVIVHLAEMAVTWPVIAEIEINPLIVLPAGQGAYAVDARLRIDPQRQG